MDSKVCSRCGIDKPFSEYPKRADRPIGVRPACRECQRKIDTQYRTTEKGKRKTRKQLWKQAGINITYEEYTKKYETVGGRCEICGDLKDNLCVDHDHRTGIIRGLLCTPCNLAIENLKESPEIMNNAITYIKKYGGRNV